MRILLRSLRILLLHTYTLHKATFGWPTTIYCFIEIHSTRDHVDLFCALHFRSTSNAFKHGQFFPRLQTLFKVIFRNFNYNYKVQNLKNYSLCNLKQFISART